MQDQLQTSLNLRSCTYASEWLNAMLESNAVLSAILAVIHPSLYDAGWKTMNRLRNTPWIEDHDVIMQWASTFSSASVISNRITPLHRDQNLRYNWYDMLVTSGNYGNCNLKLLGIEVSLKYGPGTVVDISGYALQQEVPYFERDRV